MIRPPCGKYRSIVCAATLAFAAIILPADPGRATPSPPEPTLQIRAALERPTELAVAGITLDRATLSQAYATRDFTPVWIGRSPMEAALADALAALQEDGIDPEAVGIGAVRAALADKAISATDRELLMTDRYLAAARMLAQGAIAPSNIESDWALPRPTFDPAAALARLAESGDPRPTLEGFAPASAHYRGLKAALRQYQTLAARGGWPTMPPALPIEPGATGPAVSILRERLQAEGDISDATIGGDIYDAATGAAVRQFQSRHGIAVDGRVGMDTLRTLNVGVADRVQQILLNLERLRTMPHDWPATRIEVNVAAATLTFYRDDELALSSPVIVGDPKHPTPVLSAQANAVLLNPPWNVPISIVRKEIQPKLRRNADYLERNHFVLLGREGGDPQGRDVDWTQTTILTQGWRLRQEPGPWNSLGRIKIDLPNPFDVYLHDTPARSLFAKPMRALSHGCIRVEAVHRLAETLLGVGWPGEAIDQAIAAGETQRIPLSSPVPVYLIYLTAFASDAGPVEFRDDLYGRDARLAEGLAQIKAARERAHPVDPALFAGCPVG